MTGVAPILTAGMLMQFLYGSRLISADLSRKEDRALFQGEANVHRYIVFIAYSGAQKVIVVLVALVQASLLVVAGAFGPTSVIGSTYQCRSIRDFCYRQPQGPLPSCPDGDLKHRCDDYG